MRLCKGHDSVFMASNPQLGKLGYLVIDSRFNGMSVGGIRILPDISLAETSHMARTQTKKYLFTNLPFGGAKAAMFPGIKREENLRAFGNAISPFMRNGFIPGLDMGASPKDVLHLYEGARLPPPKRMPESAKYTAWTVIASLDVALERLNQDWKGRKVAIEGFGAVGSKTALAAQKKGATVVAISNINGCLVDPNGLDIPKLLEEKSELGDDFINLHKKKNKEEIFSVDCDIFIPSARSWSINESNIRKIKAQIISCAANVPMSLEHERILWKNGRVIIPDAVANCGGVLGATLSAYMADEEIMDIVEKRYKKRVNDVLASENAPSDHVAEFCSARTSRRTQTHRKKSILNSVKRLTGRFTAKSQLERMLFPEV